MPFWNPRSPPPHVGAMNSNVKKEEPSFWYPRYCNADVKETMHDNATAIRKYDLSAAAWENHPIMSQSDPVVEIQYTYLKNPPPAPKKE